MTVVVWVVEKNWRIHMWGDLRGSADEDIAQYTTPKVFKKWDVLFGFAGSFRVADVLQYVLKDVPKEEKAYENPEISEDLESQDTELLRKYLDCKSYIVEFLIPAIKKVLKEEEVIAKHKDWTPKLLSDLLIGYGNKLFMIQDDFSVLENVNWFEAIGAWRPQAIWNITNPKRHWWKITTKPQEKIRAAIEAAIEAVSQSNSSVSKECLVLTLESDKVRNKIKQILTERDNQTEKDKRANWRGKKIAGAKETKSEGTNKLSDTWDQKNPWEPNTSSTARDEIQVIWKTNGGFSSDEIVDNSPQESN